MSKPYYNVELLEGEWDELYDYPYTYLIARHGDFGDPDYAPVIVKEGGANTRKECIDEVLAYLESVGAEIN